MLNRIYLILRTNSKETCSYEKKAWTLSYKSALYVPLEFVLENKISSKNYSSLIQTHLQFSSDLIFKRKDSVTQNKAQLQIETQKSTQETQNAELAASFEVDNSSNDQIKELQAENANFREIIQELESELEAERNTVIGTDSILLTL